LKNIGKDKCCPSHQAQASASYSCISLEPEVARRLSYYECIGNGCAKDRMISTGTASLGRRMRYSMMAAEAA
jgi:hypothetical protein